MENWAWINFPLKTGRSLRPKFFTGLPETWGKPSAYSGPLRSHVEIWRLDAALWWQCRLAWAALRVRHVLNIFNDKLRYVWCGKHPAPRSPTQKFVCMCRDTRDPSSALQSVPSWTRMPRAIHGSFHDQKISKNILINLILLHEFLNNLQ